MYSNAFKIKHWLGRAAQSCLGLVLGLALALTLGLTPAAHAKWFADADTQQSIAVAQLPAEAQKVLQLIKSGGEFKYAKDGVVFGNREGILPKQKRGYYHEYTVKTPGERSRGARRIIAGSGSTGNVQTSGEYYYTDDHYSSFKRIKE